MPKLLRKPSKTEDAAQSAFRVVQRVIERTEDEPVTRPADVVSITKRKNPAAVALGRRGGRQSAKARMEKIAPETRRAIASHAARTRWAKQKGDDT